MDRLPRIDALSPLSVFPNWSWEVAEFTLLAKSYRRTLRVLVPRGLADWREPPEPFDRGLLETEGAQARRRLLASTGAGECYRWGLPEICQAA